jgi:hypothetical protein
MKVSIVELQQHPPVGEATIAAGKIECASSTLAAATAAAATAAAAGYKY